MTSDPGFYITMAATSLLALAMLIAAGYKGFMAWLDFKRAELAPAHPAPVSPTSNRIELADLKERLRKLEAIAAGVDL
ncbi:MAG: hypothetical protein IPN84_13790 [Sphingomonadales bacterium]|jgi:hypothetical protein|nr:hypothetical protein [Sphingomonadales bacterium]